MARPRADGRPLRRLDRIGAGAARASPGRAHASTRDDGRAQLDLGGIGKGYAVDRVAELLEEWEVRHALVHGGFSSVLALEPPPERDGWPLTLSAPAPPGPGSSQRGTGSWRASRLDGRPGARRASARGTTSWTRGPACPAHAGERRPGRRSPGGTGEKSATFADALSTAFMLQPVEEIAALCRACPGLEAWIVPDPQEAGGEAPAVRSPGRAGR